MTSAVTRLYLINFSLLITHEIDAAYWHEWDMFHLSGGIQLFNLINLFLVAILIYGFQQVVLQNKRGYYFSLFLAACGIGGMLTHAGFLFLDYPQFTLPVSLAILTGVFCISIAQAVVTIGNKRYFALVE